MTTGVQQLMTEVERVADKGTVSFTRDRELPWLLPRVGWPVG